MNRNLHRQYGYRRLLLLGTLAGAVAWSLVPSVHLAAAEMKANAYDRQIARTVARFLGEEHLSKQPLNEEMSQRTFTTFLKSLDPMKVYFLQSDIDEFAQSQNKLADQIKNGDVKFAYNVFRGFWSGSISA